MLIVGIFLWTVVHLFVSIGAASRARLIAKIGAGPYRALFSLLMLGVLLLIVRGSLRTNARTAFAYRSVRSSSGSGVFEGSSCIAAARLEFSN